IVEINPAPGDFIFLVRILRGFQSTVIYQSEHAARSDQSLLEYAEVLTHLVDWFKETFHVLDECKNQPGCNGCLKAEKTEITAMASICIMLMAGRSNSPSRRTVFILYSLCSS